MCKMPPPHRLRMLNTNHLPYAPSLPYQLPQQHVMRTISQHMTDAKHLLPRLFPRLPKRGSDDQTALEGGGEGLLATYVDAEMGDAADDFFVLFVEDADEYCVDTRTTPTATVAIVIGADAGLAAVFFIRHPLLPIRKSQALLRFAITPDKFPSEFFPLELHGLTNSCYNSIAACFRRFCVPRAARPGTDNHYPGCSFEV